MIKLFVYGTLKSPQVQQKVFSRKITPSTDRLRDYRMNNIHLGKHIYPTAIQSPGGVIRGGVIDINSQELLLADSYEGKSYQRVRVILESGTQAWAYVSPKPAEK